MKIIITETQYENLVESKPEPMQYSIDEALEQLKKNCERGYYVRSHRDVICDSIELIEGIKVKDVSKSFSKGHLEKKELSSLQITINVYVESIHEYNNLDNFIYELQEEVRDVMGTKYVSLLVNNVINKRM